MKNLKKLDLVISIIVTLITVGVSLAVALPIGLAKPILLLATIPAGILVYVLWEGIIWAIGFAVLHINTNTCIAKNELYYAIERCSKLNRRAMRDYIRKTLGKSAN